MALAGAGSPAGVQNVPVAVSSGEAATGDTIVVNVTVDMTASGKAVGSVEARLTFEPSVVAYVAATQGGFEGLLEFNADSASSGVLRFAGINADDGKNAGSFVVFQASFRVVGDFGTSSAVMLEVRELTATDFTSLAGEVVVSQGLVEVKPGAIGLGIWPEAGCVPLVASRPFGLRAFLGMTEAVIGAFSGQLVLDPAQVVVDSLVASTFGGVVTANVEIHADSGYVRFAGANASPAEGDSVDLFVAYLRGVGSSGATVVVEPMLDELSDANQISDILPFVVGLWPGVITVLPGVWGDASKSWSETPPPQEPITAMDALICLSGVVGKDVSQFEFAACDVAPDDGEAYTGLVTALDALVILSHVVGKDTSPFRVAVPRC